MGGSSLLLKYDNSLSKLLSAVYPEYEWDMSRFVHRPRNYWSDETNQKKWMDWAGKELKIKEMSDWYHVSTQVKSGVLICG